MPAPDDCTRCTLFRSRLCVVNSTLPKGAEVLIVGEAPGRQEEEQRKGFVGDAGEYLRNVLREVGFDPRKMAYANACRCRPPLSPKKKQRAPTPKQIAACGDFLAEDIKRLKPKLILALGRSALEAVHRKTTMAECMGAPFVCDRFGIPTIVAYHPSAVMQGYQEARTFRVALERAKKFIDGDTASDLGVYKVIAPGDGYTEEAALRDLEWLRDDLLAAERFTFDFETDSKDTRVAKVFCASFSRREKEGYVVPLLGRYVECEGQTVEEVVEVIGIGGRTPRQIWSPKALARVKEILTEILTSDVDKDAQNGIYDVECARNDLGIEVRRFTFDLMLVHHISINERPPHNLEVLRAAFTTMPPYNIELKRWAPSDQHVFVAAPDDVLWQYSGADADCEFRIGTAIRKALRKEEDKYAPLGTRFTWLLREVAMPLQRALSYTTTRGIPLHMELLDVLAEQLVEGRDELEAKMNGILTDLGIMPPRNYDSWQQLARLMYNPKEPLYDCTCGKQFPDADALESHLLDKYYKKGHERGGHEEKGLGLPRRAADSREALEGKTREPTDTDAIATVLEGRDINGRPLKVSKRYKELLTALQRFKYYTRMRGTFIGDVERTKGWPKHVRDEWDGRGVVHTHFHIPGTATGRLSSSDPNAQNPPRDVVFRNCIRPPKGFWVIDADYSQVENRVMAYGARCRAYLRDLLTCSTCHEVFEGRPREFEEHIKLDGHGRGDMHRKSAAHIYKVAEEAVSKMMRDNAKRFVHATNYGVSAGTVARRFHLTFEDAQSQIDNYFEPYPELRDFQRKIIPRQLKRHEAVTNILGRIHRFEGYNALRRYIESEREWDKPKVAKSPKHARYLLNNMKREAISTFPQSSSADLLHLATVGLGDWRGVEEYGSEVLIHRLLKDRLGDYPATIFRHEFDAYIAISLHDSLVAIAPEKYVEQARDLMCSVMFETPLVAIPAQQAEYGPHPIYGEWPEGWSLPVEASVRERWGTDNYPDNDEPLGDDELCVDFMVPGSAVVSAPETTMTKKPIRSVRPGRRLGGG